MNNFLKNILCASCTVFLAISLAFCTKEDTQKTKLSRQQVKLLALDSAKNFSKEEAQKHRLILGKILKSPELFGTEETSYLCSTFTFFINFIISKRFSRLNAIKDASLFLSKIMLDADFERLKEN